MAITTLHCSVITPEHQVLDTEATQVILPAHDGLVGILHDRAPLLCELGTGVLRVETSAGTKELFVDGGFAQVLNNDVTVLTERAALAEDISAAAAQKALQLAEAMPAHDEASVTARQHAIDRAKTQLKIAKK